MSALDCFSPIQSVSAAPCIFIELAMWLDPTGFKMMFATS